MFGVDLESKRNGRVKTEANTEPPPKRAGSAVRSGRPTKMFFGVEVEDLDPSTGPEFETAAAGAPALLAPEPTTQNSDVQELSGETTGESRVGGGFSLQALFGVITVFALLCGMCLAVAIAARTERTRQRDRAELAEDRAQSLEKDVKLIHGRLSELENDKAQLTAQLDSARNELELGKKAEAKKLKVAKKKHR